MSSRSRATCGALEHGLARLQDGFPLSRLIREMHGMLLARGRGSDRDPGEFRRSQNWIGGTRPGNAAFVPAPHTASPTASATWSASSTMSAATPVLLKAALAHVQFETIHPFLDGNGRVGRLLITLILCNAGILSEPLLYLSLYFKQNRAEYYRLLDVVRSDGDWEAWTRFFLRGVAETAGSAVSTAKRLTALFSSDRELIQTQGRRAGSALRILTRSPRRAVLTLPARSNGPVSPSRAHPTA